jgi:hypothetical protein
LAGALTVPKALGDNGVMSGPSQPLDLTPLAEVIDNAAVDGSTIVFSYVDDEDFPALSYRGSTHVHSPQQLALWSRSARGALVESLAVRPKVSLLYFNSKRSPRHLSIRGTARVDPSANDAVYAAMHPYERDADPDRAGVAIVVDVQSIVGMGEDGPFRLAR